MWRVTSMSTVAFSSVLSALSSSTSAWHAASLMAMASVPRNLAANWESTNGVSCGAGCTGGPAAPPVARSRRRRCCPERPRLLRACPRAVSGMRARACWRPSRPLTAGLSGRMQARHPHSAIKFWAGLLPGTQWWHRAHRQACSPPAGQGRRADAHCRTARPRASRVGCPCQRCPRQRPWPRRSRRAACGGGHGCWEAPLPCPAQSPAPPPSPHGSARGPCLPRRRPAGIGRPRRPAARPPRMRMRMRAHAPADA